MANTKSAIKRIKISAKRNLRNRMVKSSVRTAVRKFNDLTTVESLRAAISTLDKAVRKGVLHRNTASRKKSRLTLKLNKLTAAE
ncbi:MAG: 30S ribosomal protein S20 [Firmicutes bacterium]|nr:30S ribosomal protein S20 [Dethiobacter sp.]MBS3889444.1 30S ribosomal protein S20 [Bacillota bacterium]MBS4054864.1 30S ribosomal protein S20 [Thermaerobacter sp.]